MIVRRIARKRRPSVCIVRHNYYPDTHVRRDAEALVDAGYDVTVLALRRPGQPARESLSGVSVRRLPVTHRRGNVLHYLWEYSAFFTLVFLTLSHLHLRKRFALIEVDNMPDVLVFSAIVPKLMGCPVILYVFDNMPELLAYLRHVSDRHPLVRLLAFFEHVSARFADHVIVTQDLPRRLAISRGVPERKLTVVLNSADETTFNRKGVTVAGTDGGGFDIVTHGTLLERYGVQVLIDAMPNILAAVPDARVQVFGEGEYRTELERRVTQLGLSDHVQFRGYAPLQELLEALAHADVGYVGMLNDLVLPNKLMEYVALGVPVALSRWGTFLHYFPEDAAIYFRAGDAADLARVQVDAYRDPAAARARALRASAKYAHYRWAVQKEVYLGLYARMLGSAARATTGHVEQPQQLAG